MTETQERTLDYKDLPYIVTVEDNSANDGIRIYDLTVKTPGHNPKTLIKDVSLHLKKGESYVVTGDSGSGKTLTANAIMGLHHDGNGLIVMPSGVKIMQMSQTPYFSDTNMRGILNMRPSDKYEFSDEDLANVLIQVGLDQLVEQIPGQQVRLITDHVMQDIQARLKPYATSDKPDVDRLYEDIAPLVNTHMAEKFKTVQHVPEEQRQYLREKLQDSLTKAGVGLTAEQNEQLVTRLIDKIERNLTQPAYEYLTPFIKEKAYTQRGKFIPYTASKAAFYAAQFEKRLSKKLGRYLENQDTDDKDREVRLSTSQAAYLTAHLSGTLKTEFMRYAKGGAPLYTEISLRPVRPQINWPSHSEGVGTLGKFFRGAAWPLTIGAAWIWENKSWPNKLRKKFEDSARNSSLSSLFHILTSPISALTLRLKANKASREIAQSLSFFMARQITTGENLTLSGGERQKLTIAQILLHKPDILFMDEITAALNQETAEKLYQQILDHKNDDTILFSIAHNSYIIKYHTHHLHLTDKKIQVNAVVPEQPTANDVPKPS